MRRLRFGLIGCLVLLLTASCDAPGPRPTIEPGAPLLTFQRIGGIAGFQDTLLIGYRGEFSLSQGGGRDRIGTLAKQRMAQLASWRDAFLPFVMQLEDNPGGPDNMIRRVELGGLGRRNATDAEQRAVMDWAAELLVELSTTKN